MNLVHVAQWSERSGVIRYIVDDKGENRKGGGSNPSLDFSCFEYFLFASPGELGEVFFLRGKMTCLGKK